MLVRDIMTRQVVAIGPDMPIGDVIALMAQRALRHFPIVENERLLGIVSDRDLRTVGADHPAAKTGVTHKDPVHRIMTRSVWTAHPLDPVDEAASLLRSHTIGAMPVMEDEVLVGIVTGVDFLDALIAMTGVGRASTRLEVDLPNRPGALAGLLDRVAARGANVASVLTTRSEPDAVSFVLRVGTMDGRGLARALREAGYDITWPPERKDDGTA
ncbi:MAG: CBS and ACT domain-containing protein [Trueperaceae bacterium]|nr:CBS and ACT domain-containing protein [Trueperaceae bacterium]